MKTEKIAYGREIFICALLMTLTHGLFYGVFFAYGIVQVMMGSVVIWWMYTIRERVTDRVTRRLLFLCAGSLLAYFLMQICKYNFVDELPTMQRYLWYGYYLPIITVPLIVLCLAIGMDGEGYIKSRVPIFLWGFAILLLALLLTNDWHGLIFSFYDKPTTDTAGYRYGPVLYIVWCWAAGLALTALIVMIYHCRSHFDRKLVWKPLLPLLIGGMYLLLYGASAFGGVKDWTLKTGEVFALMVIGFLEECISVGLLESNCHYGRVFEQLGFLAEIEDREGKTAYRSSQKEELTAKQKTAAGESPIMLSGHIRLSSMELSGGRLYWTDDYEGIHKAKEQIRKINDSIETRNEILSAENDVLKHQAVLDARNYLYDQVAQTVSVQIEKLDELLSQGYQSDRQLAYAAVLEAYIKRRCNLELMALQEGKDNVKIEGRELLFALEESLRYLETGNCETFLTGDIQGIVSGKAIIDAYGAFEEKLERVFECLVVLAVNCSLENGHIILRLMYETADGDSKTIKIDTPETGGSL